MESPGTRTSTNKPGSPVSSSSNLRFLRLELESAAEPQVYNAYDQTLACPVVWCEYTLRHLAEEQVVRFRNTLRTFLGINHPHMARLHAAWVNSTTKTLVVISERLAGGNLREVLKQGPRPPLYLLKTWGKQVLQALQCLHSLNPPVILRDLKLEYMFVSGDHLKLGQYVLAKVVEGLDLHVLGAPEYVAPEAVDSAYTDRADIHSFGICMLEIATLVHPYKECSDHLDVLNAVMQNALPKP